MWGGGPLSTKLSALKKRWTRLCRRLYLQGVALRRCWGTCASPASPWPPSSRPCTCRPSPPSVGPASSRTTAACTHRPPSLLGRHSGRAGGQWPLPSPPPSLVPPFPAPRTQLPSTLPAPAPSLSLGCPFLPLSPPLGHPFLPGTRSPPPGSPLSPPSLTFLRATAPRAGLQPPAPRHPLLLLQPLLLRVGLVPVPLLHQPLVRPQAAVCGRHALLVLVEGQGQLGEVVHVLGVLPVAAGRRERSRRAPGPRVHPWNSPSQRLAPSSFTACTLHTRSTDLHLFCYILLFWEFADFHPFFNLITTALTTRTWRCPLFTSVM